MGNSRAPWCTEVHLARTLTEDLGHEVQFLQEDETPADAVPGLAEGSDLLFWTRTEGFLKGDATKMLQRLRGLGVPSVSYHLDLYVGLKREDGLDTDPFWRTDYVFSADGDPRSQAVFESKGINHHWLPPAVFRQECVPGHFDPKFDSPVGFVGSLEHYHQEWTHRPQLIQYLERYYGPRFKRWPRDQPAVRGQDLNNLCASVDVLVGDSLCLGYDHANYLSDRVFEQIGRGGFLIHPNVPGIEDFFTDGENIVLYEFGDFEGLVGKVDYYLSNTQEAGKIADAGRELVTREHTYTNRLQTVINTIKDSQ